MIHHNYYHINANQQGQEIDVSQVSFTLAWQKKSQDLFDVDVYPLSKRWGTIIQDTGDGTGWVSISVSDETGPVTNAHVDSLSANTSGAPRSANVRFYDISGGATDVNVTVTQMQQPA